MLSIPIRLVSTPASEVDLLVWTLGKKRAVPINYRNVRINQARIAWIWSSGWLVPFHETNYQKLVREAIYEVGGKAFATDFAGPSAIMHKRIYDKERIDLEKLRRIENPVDLVPELVQQGFVPNLAVDIDPPLLDLKIAELLRKHLPMPEMILTVGVPGDWFPGTEEMYQEEKAKPEFRSLVEESFYSRMWGYEEYIEGIDYDLSAFVDDLEIFIVEPLQAAQILFEKHPYLTRFSTSIVTGQTTVDPVFVLHPDLPDIPHQYTADASFKCLGEYEALATLILEDGRTFRYNPFGPAREYRSPGPLQPAVDRIEQFHETGPPTIIRRETQVSQDEWLGDSSESLMLLPNYPNPFNSSTILPFYTSKVIPSLVLKIYNLLGQPIRTFSEKSVQPGLHHFIWDGSNDSGNIVSSGIYIYSFEIETTHFIRKLVLIR